MSADVFISYARVASLTQARGLRDQLQAEGITVFHDERNIEFGSSFPADLARALENARVVVILLDATYFARPWCAYEFDVLAAAYRTEGRETALDHVIVALPSGGESARLLAQLPPPLAKRSWPTVDGTEPIAALVRERLATAIGRLGDTIATVNDDAVERLRGGGDIALAWPKAGDAGAGAPPARIAHLELMPRSREQEFVGHARELWQVVRALVTQRAFGLIRSCAVQGAGGSGKSQIAAEFVARYGTLFFPGGIIWTSAEGDDASLVAQWRAIWPALAPGVADPSAAAGANHASARSMLGAALRDRLAQHAAPQTLLWIVDGLPETAAGQPANPRAWCPALDVTSVLITTRRAGLEGAQEHVAVGALSLASGLALLTRPPVDRRWLPDDDWHALVQWVGGLPLALTILQASLGDGFTTAQALTLARGGEASQQLDAEMDTLREEVADSRLRGVAQTFAFSFQALGGGSPLQQACRVMSLFSGVPIPESVLTRLIEPAVVGRLAKRSWIEPAGETGIRRWSMHRVAASFLRVHGGDLDPVFAAVFDRAAAIDVESLTGGDRHALGWQLVHVRKLFDRRLAAGQPLPAATASAFRFGVETAGTLPTSHSVGWRYLAASIGARIGASEEIAARLSAALPAADEERLAFVPQVIQPLRGSAAGDLMRRLLDDQRPLIQARAIVHASSLMDLDLAPPLLERLLEWPNDNLKTSFDEYLRADCPDVRALISQLLRELPASSAMRRQRAVELLGRALGVNPPDFQAGGYTAVNIAATLARLALDDPDEGVREAALSGASTRFDAAVHAVFARAHAAAGDDTQACQTVQRWGEYLEQAQRPAMPRVERIEGEQGETLRITPGAASPLPPDAYDPLIDIAAGEARAAAVAAAAILRSAEGQMAIGRAANAALDAGAFDRVRTLSDRLVEADAGFVNAWWWRAQARRSLGDADGALGDLERVEALMPEFAPLFSLRGEVLAGRDDFAAAVLAWARVVTVEPTDTRAQQMLWYCLYRLRRFEEAEAAAARAIECGLDNAESWFERGVARAAIGRLDEAVADLRQAMRLDPAHAQARETLARFEAAQGGE